jgi:hypothetical protein
VKADLAAFSPANANAKAVISALVKDLNQTISGPSIYDQARFRNVALRPETEQLLHRAASAQDVVRLNKLLLEDACPGELAKSVSAGWTVKDGAMARIGSGRGVIYTAKDYGRFRLMLSMRHVSGNPDHQPAFSSSVLSRRPMKNRSMPLAASSSRSHAAATGTTAPVSTTRAAPNSPL